MPEEEVEIAYCHACGTSMDVSAVAPFSNVECPSCAKHTRVKREFGPYTLLRRHAIGGMSVVFIAQDNTLDREVIVKILNEEYGGDDKRIAAFEEEARITASFSHPHVVRVFTTGRAFERFYIAMELVPGGHFEHHIKERGSIPEKEMLPLAIQIASGLKAAHGAGLIHRDMKPGNILLDAAGNAKIVDFGLALVTKGGKATAAEIWATPYYVPPETIEGQEEDFRSDVYAFGATLYHALAGKPSCNEESMDTNRLREAKKKILPLAKAAPWISADTCAIVDRAMAHEPKQRFRSYDELLSALETARQRLANGQAVAATGNGSPRRPGGTGGKIALAAASLLVVGAVGFCGWWVMQPDQPAVAPPVPVVKIPGPAEDPVAPGGGLAIGATYREAGEAVRSGDYRRARDLFIQVRDQPGVLQPTGSWAACETVICSYLDGRAGDARKDARAAAEHLQAATGMDEEIRYPLIELMEKVRGLPVIPPDRDSAAPSGAGLLAALISGLRNWEHGMPAAARPFFDKALSSDASGTDAWFAPYREIAAAYVSDADRLQKAEPESFPDDPEKCRGLVDELHAVHAGLRTKGRARFNLRTWQLELEKHARILEQSPPRQPEPEAKSVADVRAAAAQCQFSEAAALIKSPGFDAGDELTTALITLTEAAAAFLGDLEDELREPVGELPIELKEGTDSHRITGSRMGGLKVSGADGGEQDIEWAEVSPDSVIGIHRQLVKDETSETERLRRHEQAIAFDLLAGDAERGMKAGASLAMQHPSFKLRWDLVQPALK